MKSREGLMWSMQRMSPKFGKRKEATKSLERGKRQRRVYKEERGNKESGKRKEATRSLERGDEQKALTRVAGRLPPCQPYISSSRYYSKYPHILLDGH